MADFDRWSDARMVPSSPRKRQSNLSASAVSFPMDPLHEDSSYGASDHEGIEDDAENYKVVSGGRSTANILHPPLGEAQAPASSSSIFNGFGFGEDVVLPRAAQSRAGDGTFNTKKSFVPEKSSATARRQPAPPPSGGRSNNRPRSSAGQSKQSKPTTAASSKARDSAVSREFKKLAIVDSGCTGVSARSDAIPLFDVASPYRFSPSRSTQYHAKTTPQNLFLDNSLGVDLSPLIPRHQPTNNPVLSAEAQEISQLVQSPTYDMAFVAEMSDGEDDGGSGSLSSSSASDSQSGGGGSEDDQDLGLRRGRVRSRRNTRPQYQQRDSVMVHFSVYRLANTRHVNQDGKTIVMYATDDISWQFGLAQLVQFPMLDANSNESRVSGSLLGASPSGVFLDLVRVPTSPQLMDHDRAGAIPDNMPEYIKVPIHSPETLNTVKGCSIGPAELATIISATRLLPDIERSDSLLPPEPYVIIMHPDTANVDADAPFFNAQYKEWFPNWYHPQGRTAAEQHRRTLGVEGVASSRRVPLSSGRQSSQSTTSLYSPNIHALPSRQSHDRDAMLKMMDSGHGFAFFVSRDVTNTRWHKPLPVDILSSNPKELLTSLGMGGAAGFVTNNESLSSRNNKGLHDLPKSTTNCQATETFLSFVRNIPTPPGGFGQKHTHGRSAGGPKNAASGGTVCAKVRLCFHDGVLQYDRWMKEAKVGISGKSMKIEDLDRRCLLMKVMRMSAPYWVNGGLHISPLRTTAASSSSSPFSAEAAKKKSSRTWPFKDAMNPMFNYGLLNAEGTIAQITTSSMPWSMPYRRSSHAPTFIASDDYTPSPSRASSWLNGRNHQVGAKTLNGASFVMTAPSNSGGGAGAFVDDSRLVSSDRASSSSTSRDPDSPPSMHGNIAPSKFPSSLLNHAVRHLAHVVLSSSPDVSNAGQQQDRLLSHGLFGNDKSVHRLLGPSTSAYQSFPPVLDVWLSLCGSIGDRIMTDASLQDIPTYSLLASLAVRHMTTSTLLPQCQIDPDMIEFLSDSVNAADFSAMSKGSKTSTYMFPGQNPPIPLRPTSPSSTRRISSVIDIGRMMTVASATLAVPSSTARQTSFIQHHHHSTSINNSPPVQHPVVCKFVDLRTVSDQHVIMIGGSKTTIDQEMRVASSTSYIKNECRIFSFLPKHPNLVGFHGWFASGAMLGMCLERLPFSFNLLVATGTAIAVFMTSCNTVESLVLSNRDFKKCPESRRHFTTDLQRMSLIRAIIVGKIFATDDCAGISCVEDALDDHGDGGYNPRIGPHDVYISRLRMTVIQLVDNVILPFVAQRRGIHVLTCLVLHRIGALRGVAEGLQHLHCHGIVHRDIKPANIALDAGGTAKLIDLGLATHMSSNQMVPTAGNIRHLPDDFMERRGGNTRLYTYSTPSCDVYALASLVGESMRFFVEFIKSITAQPSLSSSSSSRPQDYSGCSTAEDWFPVSADKTIDQLTQSMLEVLFKASSGLKSTDVCDDNVMEQVTQHSSICPSILRQVERHLAGSQWRDMASLFASNVVDIGSINPPPPRGGTNDRPSLPEMGFLSLGDHSALNTAVVYGSCNAVLGPPRVWCASRPNPPSQPSEASICPKISTIIGMLDEFVISTMTFATSSYGSTHT